MATRFCEQCGHALGEGARYCGGCGVALPQGQAPSERPPGEWSPRSLISPKGLGAVLAACFILFTFLGSDSRREAMIRFVDRHLYEPVAAITPRNTIPEFYKRVHRSCSDFDALMGECDSNHPLVMLLRVPGAILDTGGYVLSQGPVAVVVVGVPALLFVGGLIAGMANERDWGSYVHPFSLAVTWLVGFPLFTGLFAWAIQLLILALLLMLKSLIAALAFMGIAYLIFEKLKLWDEMRKLFERGMTRVGGKRATPQAG